jgi:uncharacterized protein YndB with AHSA1/START domain
MTYVRRFATAALPDRVWRALTDPDDLAAWHGHAALFEAQPGGRVRFADPGFADVLGAVEEAVPERALRWLVHADGSRIAWTLTPTDSGTAVTVTHTGRGPEWTRDLAAITLGWNESIADLLLLLDHGIRFPRHMTRQCRFGFDAVEGPCGVTVTVVEAVGLAADAGLQPGDLVLRVGSVPVFRRCDLATLARAVQPGVEIEVAYLRLGRVLTGRGQPRRWAP